MNPNKALWEKGDFTRIATSMRASGEALIADLGIKQGFKVLDLGCGDGTTAIPAAKLGAEVLGVDIAQNLVDAGNRRVQEQGLANIRFQEGDASDLAKSLIPLTQAWPGAVVGRAETGGGDGSAAEFVAGVRGAVSRRGGLRPLAV